MLLGNKHGITGMKGQSQGHTGDPEAEHGGFSGSPVLPGNRIGITRSSMLGMTKTCCKDK